MCGISVILDFSGSVEESHLHKMMKATHHRGPDADNILVKEFERSKLLMGANRLQIIDKLEASNQPLVSLNGRYALVFNGEIYNYEELRNKLLNEGVEFITRSDTEVLLFHLVKNGVDGIRDLNGMFAFVFADLENGDLIVARDTIGIKPLFVHRGSNQVIISSEINGILASGLVKKELNEEVIPHYLAYKYAPQPATFYKHVEEMTPGMVWEVSASGEIEKTPTTPRLKTTKGAHLKNMLVDSIVQQYTQSNNTGVMLSGGVDSTLLLAILNKELGYNHVPVYSITGTGKDEAYSRKAAAQYQAEYNEVNVNLSTFDRLGEYLSTIDQPVADSASFLTWLIAEKAKGHSKVLLSGAGADELFAGYNRHKAFYTYLLNRNKNWFKGVKQARYLPQWLEVFSGLRKMAGSLDANPSITFNNFLQSEYFRLDKESIWEENLSNEQHFRRALNFDQNHYLMEDVLAITDHSSMRFSVETRVPYLDNHIITYTNSLPSLDLLSKGRKWMLKELLLSYGGEPYVGRKKKGFGLPIKEWFKQSEKKDWWSFNKKECQLHSFVTSQSIDILIKKHLSGRADFSQELWRILVLQKWLEHNFQ